MVKGADRLLGIVELVMEMMSLMMVIVMVLVTMVMIRMVRGAAQIALHIGIVIKYWAADIVYTSLQ